MGKARSGRITLTTKEGHYLGFIPSPLDPTPIKISRPILPFQRALPSRYDLREQNRLTPVRDQDGYGTCWAYATYGSLESCELTKTGTAWDFSENNIVNWAANNYDPIPNVGERGWNGADYLQSTAYLTGWFGPVAEADDPYPNPGTWQPKPVLRHIQEVYFLPDRTGPLDNDIIKSAVMQYGAVYTTMYIDLAYFNSSKTAYYYDGPESLPIHAVCIVGWDDNYPKDNFSNKPPGNGAFIIRNSWGSSWGEKGYFYISYYDTQIGKYNVVFVAGEDVTNYTQVYQYDPLGATGYTGWTNVTTAWFKNVFTAYGNEKINAVGFYTPVANSTYSLYVYVNDTQARTKSGTISIAGFHTIVLDNLVQVGAGQKFSIAVCLTTPGYDHPIAIEYPLNDYSSKATANRGESFISLDGRNWYDITDYFSNTNVCLKAYTVSAVVDTTPPTAPSNLRAQAISSSEIDLSWGASTDEGDSGLAGYSIERRQSGGNFSEIAKVDANTTSYKDTGLSANTTYEYRVRSYDNAGNYSDYSNIASATTLPLPDTTPPTAPSNLRAQAVSSSEIDLNWDASIDSGGSGLAGYAIERRKLGENFSEIARVGSDTTSYKDTGLSANTTYEYRVRAYDNAGNYSDYSNIASATTLQPDTTPPTITITSPIESSKVSSVLLLSAKVQDPNLDPDKVQFIIDDALSLTPIQSNDEFLCIAKLNEGNRKLNVIAYDTWGNRAEQEVNFQVIGTQNPPPKNIVFLCLPFKPAVGKLQNIILYDKAAFWSGNRYVLSDEPNFPTDLTYGGFWVKLAQAFDPINLKPLGASSPATQEIPLPLSKGWQAFGLPWTYPLPVSALQIEDKNGKRMSFSDAGNIIGLILFRYDGQKYQSVSNIAGMENTLYPWFGYWIMVKDDCKLVFPKEPWNVKAKRASNLDGFCLPIKAVFSDGTSEEIYIGMGKEEITSPFPPPAPYSQNQKRLSIIKNGELLYIDIRKEGGKQEWRLAVKGGATLFFPNLSYLPKGWQAILTDGDKRYYLKTTSAIKVEGDKELKVEIGEGLITPLLINMVDARSVRGGVNISWNVNLPCQVKVAIKGADGRVLRDLGMRSSSSGLNSIFWDGKGQDGRNLPAGIYIIELTAKDELNQMIKAIRMVNLR
jgi:C1A family cysteine protease/fibronectin type 3 domain-containing protein